MMPSRSQATREAYAVRAHALLRQAAERHGISSPDQVSPEILVGYLLEKKSGISRSTWRQYRAAVTQHITDTAIRLGTTEMHERAQAAIALLNADDGVKPTKRGTRTKVAKAETERAGKNYRAWESACQRADKNHELAKAETERANTNHRAWKWQKQRADANEAAARAANQRADYILARLKEEESRYSKLLFTMAKAQDKLDRAEALLMGTPSESLFCDTSWQPFEPEGPSFEPEWETQ